MLKSAVCSEFVSATMPSVQSFPRETRRSCTKQSSHRQPNSLRLVSSMSCIMHPKPYLLIIVFIFMYHGLKLCLAITFDSFIASTTNSVASPIEHLTQYCTARNYVVIHNENLPSSPRTASVAVAEFSTPSTSLQRSFLGSHSTWFPYLTAICQYWSHQNIKQSGLDD